MKSLSKYPVKVDAYAFKGRPLTASQLHFFFDTKRSKYYDLTEACAAWCEETLEYLPKILNNAILRFKTEGDAAMFVLAWR